jgi:hypothetical protein
MQNDNTKDTCCTLPLYDSTTTLIVVKRYKYSDGYSLLSCLYYKLIYPPRLISLVHLLGSSDPTTIWSVPVTCISSTAVDTQSTISTIFRCPAGNSLGHGDPLITTSDNEHLPYEVTLPLGVHTVFRRYRMNRMIARVRARWANMLHPVIIRQCATKNGHTQCCRGRWKYSKAIPLPTSTMVLKVFWSDIEWG